jgi:hypothetical protein
MWKGLLMLAAAAGGIVLAILGLAALTIPDDPTFSESLAGASASPSADGSHDFVPTAIGGELIMRGARAGTLSLEDAVLGASFGLGNSQGRIFFEPDPLQVTQMSFDGLELFPDPDDCVFTTGEQNEERGLVAVGIECAELVDIRDNGTITLEGYLALPVYFIAEFDMPEPGGVILVGTETWEIDEAVLYEDPRGDSGLSLFASAGWMQFGYADEELQAAALAYGQEFVVFSPDDCTVTTGDPIVAGPGIEFIEMDFTCPRVDIPGSGTIPIEGHVVFERGRFIEP